MVAKAVDIQLPPRTRYENRKHVRAVMIAAWG